MKTTLTKRIVSLLIAVFASFSLMTMTAFASEGTEYTISYQWAGDYPETERLPGEFTGFDIAAAGSSFNFASATAPYSAGYKLEVWNETAAIGAYVFVGWDHSGTETINGNVTATGTWKYEAYSSYTVTYTDGANGESFSTQTTTVYAGESTPAFQGSTPVRTGYTFAGWSPSIAGTVSGSATYTAQWNKDPEPAAEESTEETPAAEESKVESSTSSSKSGNSGTGSSGSTNSGNGQKSSTPSSTPKSSGSTTSSTPKTEESKVEEAPEEEAENSEVAEEPEEEESKEEESAVEESEEPESEESEEIEEAAAESEEEKDESEAEAIEESEVPLAGTIADSSKSHTGAIIGTVAGIAAVACGLIFFLIRRKKQNEEA